MRCSLLKINQVIKLSILLTFKFSEEIIKIKIDNKSIYYTDRIFQNMIRIVPPDGNIMLKIMNSRNKIPKSLAELFTLTKEEQQEYDNCNTDEDLSIICINDAKKKGGKLISIEKDGK